MALLLRWSKEDMFWSFNSSMISYRRTVAFIMIDTISASKLGLVLHALPSLPASRLQ